MNPEHWELEFYEAVNGQRPCEEFIESLPPTARRSLMWALVLILGRQGVDVCGTEFGKQLGGGLFEFRLRHDESEILRRVRPDLADNLAGVTGGTALTLRVFCHAYGNKVVLLLGGYDKGRDPSRGRQQREIREARKALERFKASRRGVDPESAPAVQLSERGVPVERSFATFWKGARPRGPVRNP